MRSTRPDLKPGRPELRPERPRRPDWRGTDKQTGKWMNESPPVFYRTSSPSGPLPKKNKSSKDHTWSVVPVALLMVLR